jgi:hypothetical protein
MVEAELRAIRESLADMKAWTKSHETEEFAFHGRVEGHMVDTARVMATSVEHRQDLARRIDHIELEMRDTWNLMQTIRRDVTLLFGGLIVVSVCVMPIIGYALWWIVNHK